MTNAFDTFIDSMFSVERWPFWTVAFIFAIIGQFTSKSLFTRERAYTKWPKASHRHFWWWGRETLSLHPIIMGFALGLVWRDPENAHWSRMGSAMYFAASGAVSLFFWSIAKAIAKKKGITLTLPGDSSNPPPPTERKEKPE